MLSFSSRPPWEDERGQSSRLIAIVGYTLQKAVLILLVRRVHYTVFVVHCGLLSVYLKLVKYKIGYPIHSVENS